MPDNDNDFNFLEKLSLGKLEEILYQEFLATDTDPDSEYDIKIVEAINKKENSKADLVDIQSAWEDFVSYYNTDDGKQHSLYRNMNSSSMNTKSDVPNHQNPKGYRSKTKYFLILVAVIVLAIGTMIPVAGFKNIFHMFATWSDGTFYFTPTKNELSSATSSVSNNESELTNLHESLDAYHVNFNIAPTWLPDGFELLDLQVDEFPASGKIEFYSQYNNGNHYINISIKMYTNPTSSYYEINTKAEPETYTTGGINHYIFKNMDQINAVWYISNFECSISGDISEDNLKNMINSIYQT